MNMSSRFGFVVLFLSAFFNAAGFHATKAALQDSTPLTVTLLGSIFSLLIFSFLGILWRCGGWTAGDLHQLRWSTALVCVRQNCKLVIAVPILLALSGWLVNTCLQHYGAEVTAFLMNLTLVFLVTAGWLSGEELQGREVLAIGFMIGGACVFSYRGGSIVWGVLGLMALACGAIAGKQLLVKHISNRTPLPVAMCVVMGPSIVWIAILLGCTGQWQLTSMRTVAFAALGAVLCSVVGMTLLYRAYHMVGVARGAPFNALRPLVVLLLGLALGNEMPTSLQLVGAAFILAGSVALSVWHRASPQSQATQSALAKKSAPA